MEGFEAILAIMNKLGGVSFATLLALILYGSKRSVWFWGEYVTELKTNHAAEKTRMQEDFNRKLDEIREDRDWWRNGVITATGLLERGINLRERQELSKIERANRDINRS